MPEQLRCWPPSLTACIWSWGHTWGKESTEAPLSPRPSTCMLWHRWTPTPQHKCDFITEHKSFHINYWKQTQVLETLLKGSLFASPADSVLVLQSLQDPALQSSHCPQGLGGQLIQWPQSNSIYCPPSLGSAQELAWQIIPVRAGNGVAQASNPRGKGISELEAAREI